MTASTLESDLASATATPHDLLDTAPGHPEDRNPHRRETMVGRALGVLDAFRGRAVLGVSDVAEEIAATLIRASFE